MSYYPTRIGDHFLEPHNVGEIENADAVAQTGSFTCGAVLRLSLEIDNETQRILGAKFRGAGCGYLIASASVLTDIVRGLTTAEAATACALFQEMLLEYFGEPPKERAHCSQLCSEALREAVAGYSQRVRDEWTGEEALICTCFGVSEKRIEEAIQEKNLHTVSEVTRACNAGGGCHSCHPLIEEMIEDYRRSFEERFDWDS